MSSQQITYEEKGSGPAVLFVPGSFSTPAAWRELQAVLPAKFRMISTSLLGYGRTAETRSLDSFKMEHEVELLATVGERINEPFHLVGHSFGGTVGLAAVLAGKADVLSITTFEANPINLISAQGEQKLYASVQEMSTTFEAAYNEGEHHAARRIIDFWGGTGSFSSMPDMVQDYCQTTCFTNVLDWRTVFTFDISAKDFADVSVPTLIVRSANANPAMEVISKALSEAIPFAKTATVENSNHFLITSHPHQCAELLANHLEVAG